MTLSVSGCSRLWRSAQASRPAPWEGRASCIGCPIGADHAGQSREEARAARAAETLRRICPRCPGGPRPASRLINGAFCVSCYNRAREVARGRNGKGNPPAVVAARLHAVALAVAPSEAGSAPSVEVFPAVTSRVEAMILAAKRAGGRPLLFGAPHMAMRPAA